MQHFWILVSIISLTLLASPASSLADSCAAIASQMRAGASASNSQSAQLRRQIAAIRSLERQRSCTNEKASAGGFFNACRDLAQQRANVERKISPGGGGRSTAALQARFQALGCQTRVRKERQERVAKAPAPQKATSPYKGNAIFYCVRLSDGYRFPAPNSQFAKEDYLETAQEQCRFLCENQPVALYVLEDPELETDEMVSVATKVPYRELPTAFRYQAEEEFNACNWPRYFALVNELRTRTVTPRNLENALIPLPTRRPNLKSPPLSVAEIEIEETSSIGAQDNIRKVGPIFLPDKKIEFGARSAYAGE